MTTEKTTLNRIQAYTSIASAVAIPIVIALVGWWVQSSISNESIKKDYVQMAIGILNSPDNEKNTEMRKWAVDILNENSPVPLSLNLRNKLEQGSTFLIPSYLNPPEVFMKPPLELEPLSTTEDVTLRKLMIHTVENYGRCRENAITLEHLQKWLVEMQAIHTKP